MKKIIIFLNLLIISLTASAEIPFSEAWSYVAGFTSYKVGVTLGVLFTLLGALFINNRLKEKGADVVVLGILSIVLFVLLYVTLVPVAECAANSFVKDGVTIFIR